MDRLLSIVEQIWFFIQDIFDGMRTFIVMLGDAFKSAITMFNVDFLPSPLTTCILVLFCTALVKAITTLGGSNV